jgi:hypothetical protein
VEQLHRRLVAIAQEKKIVEGRKLRVDTTVVETNIHYPTDSSLLGDGVRVLTRLMKRPTEVAGEVGTKLRDRTRRVKLRVVEIARASRGKGQQGQERMKGLDQKLLTSTVAVVGQAQRFVKDIAEGVKRSADVLQQAALEGIQKELESMAPRVKQVIQQTRARVLRGDTHAEGKIVSLFEPTTDVIRRGNAKQPTEFGKMIKVQEAEAQIITVTPGNNRRPLKAIFQRAFSRLSSLTPSRNLFFQKKRILRRKVASCPPCPKPPTTRTTRLEPQSEPLASALIALPASLPRGRKAQHSGNRNGDARTLDRYPDTPALGSARPPLCSTMRKPCPSRRPALPTARSATATRTLCSPASLPPRTTCAMPPDSQTFEKLTR